MKRLFVFIFLIAVVFTSCHHLNGDRVRGNGNIKTESRSVQAFNGVDAGGNIEVFVKQDSTRSVRIEADENLMEYIIVMIEGDDLLIEPKSGYNLSGSKDIKVYVSAPAFKKFEASGASGITGENTITTTETIDISVTGASNARLDVKAPKVSAEMTGASHITLTGETRDLSVDGTGASHAKCFGLLSENADVDVAGASSAEVFASVNLKADASGASHIRYKGAATVSQSASGASGVRKVE